MDTNGINYYKGVLLCSRPNENPSISKKKDFCGRVFPRQQLGLVPVKEYDQHKTKKRVLPVLNNHKKWLEKFKKEVQEKKQDEEKEKERAAERLQKIKHEGHEEREKARQATIEATNPQNTTEATKNNKEDTAPPGKNEPSLKKKQKPAWAKTANENEKHQQKEVEELLDFFNKQQEKELQDYVSDGEVKNILIELKGKIQRLKEQQNWRNHQIKKMEDDKKKEERQKDNNDDVLSRISKQSAAQSVSSHKTAERIQQLQKKKKDVDWDKMTGTQKKTMASVDEQIAKNIADELLRNYPNLKHHSNQSIRQLIQKHAHQQIKS